MRVSVKEGQNASGSTNISRTEFENLRNQMVKGNREEKCQRDNPPSTQGREKHISSHADESQCS